MLSKHFTTPGCANAASLGTLILVSAVTVLTLASMTKAVSFTKVTTGPVASDSGDSRSVNFIDYDNDGHLDLFITNGPPPPGASAFLYHGNGDGTFTKITTDTIVKTVGPCDGATFGDYDNDGDLDCWIATWYGKVNQFFTNNGDGTFSRVTTGHIGTVTSYSEAGSWADYDADGFLDLYVCNSAVSLQNLLYHNNGDGTFGLESAGPQSTDAYVSRVGVWSDYDNDNDLDIFVANESNQNNRLYKNNGDGTFASIIGVPPVNGGGSSYSGAWGDIDNDGDFDILVVNASDQNCFLYKNNGDGTFAAVAGDPIVTSPGMGVCGVFADVDNDGDLDAFITHAFGFSSDVNFLFLNNGDGSFTQESSDIVTTDPGWTYGAAFGDIDHDGDLDLAVAKCVDANEKNGLYLNNGNSNHWLEVHCVGVESNRDAVGARVRVKATINGNPVWQVREVTTQSAYCSQNDMNPHFGLGDATSIDSIEVRFPTGIIQVLTNVSPDQVITISECVNSDPDSDGKICFDNCPSVANPGQEDTDLDGVGNVCDNCPNVFNPDQADTNGNDIGDVCEGCCVGIRGNVNGDAGQLVNIVDVTFMVAYLFQGGATPPCKEEADVVVNNSVNVVDLTFLVARLFQGGPPPPNCP